MPTPLLYDIMYRFGNLLIMRGSKFFLPLHNIDRTKEILLLYTSITYSRNACLPLHRIRSVRELHEHLVRLPKQQIHHRSTPSRLHRGFKDTLDPGIGATLGHLLFKAPLVCHRTFIYNHNELAAAYLFTIPIKICTALSIASAEICS